MKTRVLLKTITSRCWLPVSAHALITDGTPMPKNFAFFQKPLDKFFYKFDNSEINRQEIFPASFKNIENREGF